MPTTTKVTKNLSASLYTNNKGSKSVEENVKLLFNYQLSKSSL